MAVNNRAAQELESLLSMQTQSEDTNANLKKLQDARTGFGIPDSDSASALPEAVATAIGIGWVLGPVGGLLMGAAAGILGQRQKQSAIDAYAKDMGILDDTNDIFNDELDRLSLTATNPNDLEQLSAMQTEKDVALRLMSAASPEMQQEGSNRLAAFSNRMNEYTVNQESQQIAADAQDAQAQRDMGKQVYSRHRALLADFDQQSGNFKAQVASADNVVEALKRGDGAALVGALATMPLLINPDAGATSEGEVDIWRGVRGWLDKNIGSLEQELGAGGLKDQTRKEIMGVALQYKRNAISTQQALQAHFGQSVITEKIPEKYWREYDKISQVPALANKGFIARDPATVAKAALGDTLDRTMETIGLEPGKFWANFSDQVGSGIDSLKNFEGGQYLEEDPNSGANK